jgi:hypothetical protein
VEQELLTLPRAHESFKIAKISIKKIFKKSVYDHYEKQLTEKLSMNNDSSKLFLMHRFI